MKTVWIFCADKTWACVFETKDAAMAYRLKYIKQALPEVARDHFDGARKEKKLYKYPTRMVHIKLSGIIA